MCHHLASLGPNEFIQWLLQKWSDTGSTLAQVMACCLMAPSHYLNQCWLIISKVLLLSCEGNFTRDASIINHYNLFENYMSKISFKFPRGQWVNSLKSTQHGITVTSTCTWSNDDLDLWQQMVSLGNRELHHRLNTNLCTNCANKLSIQVLNPMLV